MPKVSLRLFAKVKEKRVLPVIVFLKDELFQERIEIPRSKREVSKPKKFNTIMKVGNKTLSKTISNIENCCAKREVLRYTRGKQKKSFPEKSIRKNPFFDAVMMPVEMDGLKDLNKDKNVLLVAENFANKFPRPVKTAVSSKPYKKREGVTWGIHDMKIKKLWDQGYKGRGVSIGHLDTGVYEEHPDLKGKLDSFAVFSPFGEEVECKPYDADLESHGTHTAGTLVGGDSGDVSIGVAPKAKLVSGLVLPGGEGSFWMILGGMHWAAKKNVSVLSMSLGVEGYEDAYSVIMSRLMQANIFPACAIGNEYLGITDSPGNISTVCGVGAYDQKHKVPDFSSGGAFTWTDGLSIKPDLVAPGVNVYSSVREPEEPPFGPTWDSSDGTSMATPHLAGAIALLRQASPNSTVEEIMDAIYKTCHHPDGLGSHDHRFGRGFFRPVEALQEL